MRIGGGKRLGIARERINPWWKVRAEILNAWIRQAVPIPQGGIVLKTDLFDEACGPHHHGHMASAIGDFIGMDIELEIVRAGKSRLDQAGIPGGYVVCDIRSLPFADQCTSVVLSLSTLDHFPEKRDIRRSLMEIRRVMKAEGVLLLTLDNPVNPSNALRAWLPSGITARLRTNTFPLGSTLSHSQAASTLREVDLKIRSVTYLIHSFRYLAIHLLGWLQERNQHKLIVPFLFLIRKTEVFKSLPTRSITGHYSAWVLQKA